MANHNIEEQVGIPWGIAFTVSWSGLKRRFMRSLITMAGVILAIAFLAYMLISDKIVVALVAAKDDELNDLLQKSNVDIFASSATDSMMLLLIGLSLLTCLVGIINSMLMAVTERVKEIGTLKCLGALDSFIVKTYFIESSLQGVIGTIIGIILGLSVAVGIALINYGTYTFSYLPLNDIAISMLIALVIGSSISVFAAIGPAYFAARKQPVEAMRVEE